MSREAKRANSREQKGVVKTELPTKVQWVKRKYENYYKFSNFIVLPIFTYNYVKLFLLNLTIPRFILPPGPY